MTRAQVETFLVANMTGLLEPIVFQRAGEVNKKSEFINGQSINRSRACGWGVIRLLFPAASKGFRKRRGEFPPPDAVPDFNTVCQRALRLAESFGVSTNEMERDLDGSLHVHKTENTTSHLGGAVKYKSKRAVMVSRSIAGYLVRSLDEDKIELDLGVDGQLLKFNFKWPNLEATSTNHVLGVSAMMNEIKTRQALGDVTNEYPSGGIAQIEVTDFQIFYYVSNVFSDGQRSTGNADIRPMIEFLAKFKSSHGDVTEGGIFAPVTE